MEAKKTNKKFIIIFTVLILVGGTYGIYKYLHSRAHETTDDAQIEKNMNPIIPRVTGYVTKVYVKDNDFVKQGDTLFTIDNKDYLVKVEEAEAALIAAQGSYAAAKADIQGAAANVSVSDANVRSAGGNPRWIMTCHAACNSVCVSTINAPTSAATTSRRSRPSLAL